MNLTGNVGLNFSKVRPELKQIVASNFFLEILAAPVGTWQDRKVH